MIAIVTSTVAAPVPSGLAPAPTMSWGEICAAYPDQWVGLVDVVKGSEGPFDVRSARVVGASASPRDVLRTLDEYRDVDRSARHLFTGRIRSRPSP